MRNCKNKLLFFLAGVGLICACTGENKIDDEEVVEIIHVAGITLEPVSTSVKVGETVILQAVVSPDNATNQKINWTSSDNSVASVEDGTVTGIKIGNATIVATTEDGGKTAMCQVSVENNLAPAVSIDAAHVSAVSAVLGGEANLNADLSAEVKMGIQWSESAEGLASADTKIEAKIVQAKEGVQYAYEYSVKLPGLEPETKYYYRSYVTEKGQDSYGEIKEFSTKELSSLLETLDAIDVKASSATLRGVADLSDVEQVYAGITIDYGFLWGDTEDNLDNNVKGGAIEERQYSAELTDLSHKTQYWYKAYVKLNGKLYEGAIKNFVTVEVPVESISLVPASATLKEGKTVILTPVILPETATNKEVEWSSNRDDIASVVDGTVTGVKEGTAIITATAVDGGLTATCNVTVESELPPSVTIGAEHISAISVVLNGKANLGTTVSSDLKVGFQYSKSAGILPSNSTTVEAMDADANYNYTTSITGLEPSTTYYFRSFVRQNNVDVYGETKSFTTKDVTTLMETKDASDVEATRATLHAKLDLTDIKYSSITYGFYWGTSEASQNNSRTGGSISENAYTASLTDLSHKTQYWYKAYVKLDSQTFYGEVKTFTTDVVPVESVSLDKTEYTFHTIGNTLTLNATVLPSDATDKSVVWSSNKEDVATVDQNGKVTAKGNGKATITVTTKDQSKTATCEVTVAQWVTGISLDKISVTLNEGESYTLIPTVNPDNAADKSVSWTSSDDKVVIVDNSGKVTAKSKGTATITATAKDGSGKNASCSVTVKRLVSSIQLNKTSLTMYRGSSNVTETLTATVNPSTANNTSVTWTSSNTTVATVSSSGVVTGKSRGNATITVTANDGSGVSATCEVEVKQYVTWITLSKTSLSLVIGAEETISVTSVLPDNANDKTYTWSSSDNSIASVDQTGKITAIAKGNVEIRATANDGSTVHAVCSVKVIAPDAVDLGIVVNGKTVKWASFNLGATKTEEYGDYYAWGETATKSNYSWSTYKFGTSSSGPFSKYNTYSSYGTVDNKTVLDPEDDVAHVKLGGKWRMPTDEEWTALLTNCTCTWTTNYNGTGVRGRIVTSNVEGYKDKSIFFPAAGRRYGTNLYHAGSYGIYWSSSLDTDYPSYAWRFYFNSDIVFRYDYIDRYYGFSVRPVSE